MELKISILFYFTKLEEHFSNANQITHYIDENFFEFKMITGFKGRLTETSIDEIYFVIKRLQKDGYFTQKYTRLHFNKEKAIQFLRKEKIKNII